MSEASAPKTFVREGMYVRNATGLVRGISPFSATIFNILPTVPGVGLSISVFWILAAYPGAHILSAYLITGVVALAIALPFAFLSMTMPRSGGDYILVSRSIGPPFGLASSISLMFAAVLATAFVATTFVTVGLVPSFATIGLISGHHWWIDASTTMSSKNWTFALSIVMLLIALALGALPLRKSMTFMNVTFGIAMLGVVAGVITMFAVSTSSFVSKFDQVAGAGSYQKILKAASGTAAPGTSWHNTIPAVGAIAVLFVVSWWSANYGGEVQRARTWLNLASMTASIVFYVLLFVLMTVAFYHMAGDNFVAAANTVNGTKDYPLTVPPYWLVFVAIAGKSTVFAIFLIATFMFWFPIWTWLQIAQPMRALFAWSFDGVLPSKAAYVNERTGIPVVALVVTGVLSAGGIAWAIYSSNFFTVLATVTLLNMTPMLFVGIAATLLPFLKPSLWRQTPIPGKVAGIPVLTLVGLAGAGASAFVIFLFLKYPGLGITDRLNTLLSMGACIVAGFVLYYVAKAVQRTRGVDIGLHYAEIPPE
jgi:APA family basic amino acid/polyamine antiporter